MIISIPRYKFEYLHKQKVNCTNTADIVELNFFIIEVKNIASDLYIVNLPLKTETFLQMLNYIFLTSIKEKYSEVNQRKLRKRKSGKVQQIV